MRILFLALVALAAVASTDAACRGPATALAKHTMLFHATTVNSFSSSYAPAQQHRMLAASGDINHPYSPAWFAAGNNPAFSVHVALRWYAANVAGANLSPLYLFEYRTARAFNLVDCDTHVDIGNHVHGLNNALVIPNPPARVNQPETGYYFCQHHQAAGARDGYTVRHDAVRGEQEYILCHGHNEREVEWAGRTTCRVRITASTDGPAPTLWANCGVKINGGRWYKWSLNGANPIANFQDAGAGQPAFVETESQTGAREQPAIKIGGNRVQRILEPKVPIVLPKTAPQQIKPEKPAAATQALLGQAKKVLDKIWPLEAYAGPGSNPRRT